MAEVREIFKRLGLAVTKTELQLLTQGVDTDKDGRVGVSELLFKIQMKIINGSVEESSFYKIDLNHDGKVTRAELRKVPESVIFICYVLAAIASL